MCNHRWVLVSLNSGQSSGNIRRLFRRRKRMFHRLALWGFGFYRFPLVDYLPNSLNTPTLAPSDFHLFPTLKKKHYGKHFTNEDDSLLLWRTFYANEIQAHQFRWQKSGPWRWLCSKVISFNFNYFNVVRHSEDQKVSIAPYTIL